jgi:hypothetical protein
MRYRLVCAGAFVWLGCAGRYAAPASTQTSVGPEESFQCVRKELTALGYKQTSIDVDERRITAAKIDPKARRPDIQFRRMLDKLEVQVAPGPNGETSIDVEGRTFGEYATQRGPTEVEEKASADVKAAAQELLERCRG